MNLRQRLEAARKQCPFASWERLELDYALSWMLLGLSRVPVLENCLVFKGGSCLRKCYFGDYRFSQDLDFTALGPPRGEGLEAAINTACRRMQEAFEEEYADLEFSCKRYEEEQPHPRGQECFEVRIRLPWHRKAHTWPRIKLEINPTEAVLWPVSRRNLLHAYGESLEITLPAYSLEEIVAEKLRAILQFAERLQSPRGWARSRARDFYDLWRILKAYPAIFETPDFADQLARKCTAQNVHPGKLDAFFQEVVLGEVDRTWNSWLSHQVAEIPDLKIVLSDLRPALAKLLC